MEVIVQSTLTVKGQATLPKAVREHLGLKPGDRVKFFINPDGTVVMLPMLPASSLRGMLKRPGRKPVSIEEMDEGGAGGIGERDVRSKRR
jgi:antitoxin PrlF